MEERKEGIRGGVAHGRGVTMGRGGRICRGGHDGTQYWAILVTQGRKSGGRELSQFARKRADLIVSASFEYLDFVRINMRACNSALN